MTIGGGGEQGLDSKYVKAQKFSAIFFFFALTGALTNICRTATQFS
jgi:hypothetical protein